MIRNLDHESLFIIACANVKAARNNLYEDDVVLMNFALFNISEAIVKLLRFLCLCYSIDFSDSVSSFHLADKLMKKDIQIPQLIMDSLSEYVSWNTKGICEVNQIVDKGYAEKHILCVESWIASLEKQMLLKNPYSKKKS